MPTHHQGACGDPFGTSLSFFFHFGQCLARDLRSGFGLREGPFCFVQGFRDGIGASPRTLATCFPVLVVLLLLLPTLLDDGNCEFKHRVCDTVDSVWDAWDSVWDARGYWVCGWCFGLKVWTNNLGAEIPADLVKKHP